jgi:phospholipid/cholesterol/gamma-HCH transport system substrate-binding protein
MASLKTKFAVGLFLTIGLALTIVAIVWLGMSHYLDKGQRYAAYFDESVQGLDRDSPVKYRGVPVGRVEHVRVAPDAKLVEVIIRFDAKRRPEEHIENIVAQLKAIGITGIMFIELDRIKESEPKITPKFSFNPEFPVIATRPSDISKILSGVEDVIYQFKALDTKGISEKLKLTLDKINQAFNDARINDISSDLRAALKQIDSMLKDKGLAQISETITGVADSLNTLIANTNATILRLDRIVADNKEGLRVGINGFKLTLQELKQVVTRVDGILADNEPDLKTAINNFLRSMQGAEEFVSRLDRVLAANESKIDETFMQINQSAKNAEVMMQEGAGMIKNVDERIADLQRHLLVTAQNLRIASENLNSLIEIVSDQPSQLFFGEPLPERRFEKDTGK